jgi:Ca2+-binding EF-hand superfamily protein
MDSDQSGELDYSEFKKALDDYRVGCTDPEADQIFQIFDRNRNGTINFDEFMFTILGELNPYRQNIIKQAFQSLDANGNGTLEIDEVKSKYDPTRHPDVVAGVRTAEDCRSEFLDMFSTHHNVSNSFAGDRSVSLQEFTDYHHFISSFIEADKMFKLFMSGVWNMDVVDFSN